MNAMITMTVVIIMMNFLERVIIETPLKFIFDMFIWMLCNYFDKSLIPRIKLKINSITTIIAKCKPRVIEV